LALTRAENEIVGEALVALQHDDLKQMGVTSVGHRLTILKSVYDIKVKQDIPIESDHYVPLCECVSYQWRTPKLTFGSRGCGGTVRNGDAEGYKATGGTIATSGRAVNNS
jgi:hypothetical protein